MVDVPQVVLTDLAERLRRTRFPTRLPGISGRQGLPLDELREIVRYWLGAYDWRVHEARLNRYRQFVTTVDGQRIHFLHVRSRHQAAIPLFLIHGWPGSVVEFLDVIDPLADPDNPSDGFHLVVPSLPGYGFSGPTTDTGWNPQRIAAAFGQIADRLGYRRYGVQGGDWGAIVSANMAELRPDRTLGLHVNLMNVPPPSGEAGRPADRVGSAGGCGRRRLRSDPGDAAADDRLPARRLAGRAGGLADREVSRVDRPGGRRFSALTMDQLLTNVMLSYRVNRAGASSARLYWERRQAPETMVPQRPVTVPTGVANYPGELVRSLRPHAERFFNIAAWTELPRGGHFPAMGGA